MAVWQAVGGGASNQTRPWPLSGARRRSSPPGQPMTKPLNIPKLRRRRAAVGVEAPDEPGLWEKAGPFAAIGIFVLLLVAALSLARPILLPAVSAFVLMLMLGPLAARAERLGIPNVATALALWLVVLVVVYGALALVAAPVVEWIGKAPEIGRSIQLKLQVLSGPLDRIADLRNALLPSGTDKGLGVDLAAFVKPALEIVAPGVGQMLIFFGSLFFMLLGRAELRRMFIALAGTREAKLSVLKMLNEAERDLTGYLSTLAVINVCVGAGAGAIAFATGMPSPLAWAVLGFILNFIPYIGALIMEAAMFLVGLVVFPTLGLALVPPLLYLAMGTLEGHFITPSIMGRQFTLHPLTVFLSLVFWAWLWGPVGAFLAVPLLIVGVVAVNHVFPSDEPDLPE